VIVLDISGWDFLILAVLGVILFGPDRMPKLAADAGRFVRAVRRHVHDAKSDLARELGPEFPDVRITDLTPRGILRKTLGDDPFDDFRAEMDALREPVPIENPVRPLGPGEVPPFDPDTT
jgi:sec-independent protein translocase protein TatB